MKMKVAGIISEYNPFHNGHAHHIERTRAKGNGCEATHVVAVMSGNFVQRGTPAFMPKHERARMALASGADLVIELPLPWAISSAEAFALGGVSILDSLKCVDSISFGSEHGDVERLEKIADVLLSQKFSDLIKYYSSFGIAFPEARQKAVEEIGSKSLAELLQSPNNTLGIEYIKAIKTLGSTIKPYTIKRYGTGHDSHLTSGDIASASFIRELAQNGRIETALCYVPRSSREIISENIEKGYAPSDLLLAERTILAFLRKLSLEDIENTPGISEGLENRVYEAIQKAVTLEDLYQKIKTKRYTMTRVKRIILAAFLGVNRFWEGKTPPYIRVLGLNEKGAEILRAAKENMEKSEEALPVITRSSQVNTLLNDEQRNLFMLESVSTDLYAFTLPTLFECGTEFTNGIIREG